jgi:hypothetical protein
MHLGPGARAQYEVGGWLQCRVQDPKHRKANVAHMCLHSRTLEPVVVLGEVRMGEAPRVESDADDEISRGESDAEPGA